MSNAGGGVWQYRFDSAGRLQSETDFIGRTLTYEHDAAGRLIGRTTGSQERIAIDRDAVGRTVRRRSAYGTFVYRYDPVGRLIAATGPGTALEYGRDRVGRVLTETVNGRTTAFAYDAAGHRVHRVTPSGAASAWSFNSTGRAVTLEAGDGSLAFSYDAAGGEIERALGPGAWLSFAFDPAGRLSAQQLYVGDRSGRDGSEHSQTRVLDRNWVWGADGVPVEVRDSRTGTRRFTTDSLGRVTGVSGDSWNEEYAYDTFGNVAYGETDANDVGRRDIEKTLVRAAGRISYERDAEGRLIRTVRRTLDGRRKTWQYTWDAHDRLIQAVGPDGVAWRYSYDPLGRRTSKARLLPDGSVAEEILFVWDGVRVAEQYSVSDDGVLTAVTWDYEPDAFRPAAQRRRMMLADAPQHVIDEAFYAIITDLVGTPTELVTADGRIAWQTTNSLWGRTVSISADADVDCPLRFPGQYYDAETGFHYNLNRYYDPEMASYITPDPLGLAPSPNDHAYVSNPMVEFDPLGLQCVPTNIGNADLPIHPDIDKFYVRAGELVDNRVETHGLNELQMLGGEEVGHGGVSNLTNDELIVPGGPQGNDPISGYRDWAPGDSGNYPASRIVITGGHHRTAEVVSRVLSGDMDPSTLIEFAIRR